MSFLKNIMKPGKSLTGAKKGSFEYELDTHLVTAAKKHKISYGHFLVNYAFHAANSIASSLNENNVDEYIEAYKQALDQGPLPIKEKDYMHLAKCTLTIGKKHNIMLGDETVGPRGTHTKFLINKLKLAHRNIRYINSLLAINGTQPQSLLIIKKDGYYIGHIPDMLPDSQISL